MKPLVSIICITYNQDKFIRKTIDGFLDQKANFPFEILIHDDASVDNTANIIKEYTARYPDIIKPIFEKENQYSKGTFRFVNDMFMAARGVYITMCEGDDYWTDPLKLQKQVDYLEVNKDYSMCFHAVTISYDDKSEANHVSPDSRSRKSFNISNLLKDNFIYTCSVMYRARSYSQLAHSVLPQDLYLHLFHAKHGKIGFIRDVMAVYRKQSSGVWWDSGERMNSIYSTYHFQLTNLFSELLELFKDDHIYTKIIYKHLDYLFSSFATIDKANGTTLLESTAKRFPSLVAHFTINQTYFIEELKVENRRLTEQSRSQALELRNIKESRWQRLNPRHLIE